jgi:hypothetical protein
LIPVAALVAARWNSLKTSVHHSSGSIRTTESDKKVDECAAKQFPQEK